MKPPRSLAPFGPKGEWSVLRSPRPATGNRTAGRHGHPSQSRTYACDISQPSFDSSLPRLEHPNYLYAAQLVQILDGDTLDMSVDLGFHTHHKARFRLAQIDAPELPSTKARASRDFIVRDLLEDLCAFCNDDALPAIVQAALAHPQFETIHPFVDGNGRVGRVLIHLVLRRRGLAVRALPPISLILATWSGDYVAGLSATRYAGKATSAAAIAGQNRWIALFATACRRAIEDAETFEARVATLQQAWRKRLGKLRANSTLDLLIHALPGAPIVTVNAAAELIGRTFQATNQAIERLMQARVLHQVNLSARNRVFEAPELIKSFAELERKLASAAGDTRVAPPERVVPRG